jgi:hypothetical protein
MKARYDVVGKGWFSSGISYMKNLICGGRLPLQYQQD